MNQNDRSGLHPYWFMLANAEASVCGLIRHLYVRVEMLGISTFAVTPALYRVIYGLAEEGEKDDDADLLCFSAWRTLPLFLR